MTLANQVSHKEAWLHGSLLRDFFLLAPRKDTSEQFSTALSLGVPGREGNVSATSSQQMVPPGAQSSSVNMPRPKVPEALHGSMGSCYHQINTSTEMGLLNLAKSCSLPTTCREERHTNSFMYNKLATKRAEDLAVWGQRFRTESRNFQARVQMNNKTKSAHPITPTLL